MPVIASYKRSAFGRLLGWLSSLSAMQLGSQSIRAALESAGISPSDVDWVVGGQVLQAGQGQNPIRQSGVGAGIGLHVPQITLNGVCVSGMEAVSQGMRLIALGVLPPGVVCVASCKKGRTSCVDWVTTLTRCQGGPHLSRYPLQRAAARLQGA